MPGSLLGIQIWKTPLPIGNFKEKWEEMKSYHCSHGDNALVTADLSCKEKKFKLLIVNCDSILKLWASQVTLSGKEPDCHCRRYKRLQFNPWVGKIPWRRAWQPTPIFLPGELHGQRSLVGYSPWRSQKIRHEWSDLVSNHARINSTASRAKTALN